MGNPRPDRLVAGEASLDGEGRWARMQPDARRPGTAVRVPPDALLDVEGAPALVGATAQRLIRGGMRPGQTRDVEVVRVRSDRSVTPARRAAASGSAAATGACCCRSSPRASRCAADGTVAGVEAAALLVE